jgi:hypothetical protein
MCSRAAGCPSRRRASQTVRVSSTAAIDGVIYHPRPVFRLSSIDRMSQQSTSPGWHAASAPEIAQRVLYWPSLINQTLVGSSVTCCRKVRRAVIRDRFAAINGKYRAVLIYLPRGVAPADGGAIEMCTLRNDPSSLAPFGRQAPASVTQLAPCPFVGASSSQRCVEDR